MTPPIGFGFIHDDGVLEVDIDTGSAPKSFSSSNLHGWCANNGYADRVIGTVCTVLKLAYLPPCNHVLCSP
ncbi:hypothetical protein PAHAL_2G466200 [Panicum hallii]|uniref:Uncharacterized protein n=1 Tax=Panicum hallii TaxID=206008 RepID=A0A2T8KT45_9POAL|nr:hypothetical protein PAHAL_2G466200 [Panicum hallii]